MMRLIQFLNPKLYIKSIIFVLSLLQMMVYFCALVQALSVVWGIAPSVLVKNYPDA